MIYLDNAATTLLSPEALKAMSPFLKKKFGNPSSLHGLGREARAAIEKARERAAKFLNCSTEEVFFTGSATEADNLAIFGSAASHIITSVIEHPAVLEPIKNLEKSGEISATYLPVYKDGIVRVEDVKKALQPETALVSIMYANNEIGTIQPIAEIAKIIKTKNPKIIFHTDAVQAANYLDCDVQKLGVDMLTLSGHKIYGPKGVALLYIKKGAAINPIMFGGHQEGGTRPGTENVAAIAGFGAAIAELAISKSQNIKIRVQRLRDKLIDDILTKIPGASLNGSLGARLPNNANISFDRVEGESILMALDQEGIAVSTGSACASGSLAPSYVLMALGMTHQRAHGSIRFSLSKYTTEAEINYVLKILPKVIERLRKLSPLK